jgi:hypothetical protein
MKPTTYLKFPVETVRLLLQHSRTCETRRPTLDQLFDFRFLKDGVPKKAEGEIYKDIDEIDRSKIPAGLCLVKDTGCYLMSNGLPRLLNTDESRSLVAYAEGLGPHCDYDTLRTACGGDDFAEFLPAESIEAILQEQDPACPYLVIGMSKTHLALIIDKGEKPQSKQSKGKRNSNGRKKP